MQPKKAKKQLDRERPLLFMILPGIILVLIFEYLPMIGIIIAFKDFHPVRGLFGSEWVGFENFEFLIGLRGTFQVLFNTLFIAVMKIVAGLIVPIVFALLLNEVRNTILKRTIQTAVYLPHFLSWVILSGILIDILSPSVGVVNHKLRIVGIEPIFFLARADMFPYVMVISDVWKNFGFAAIIYLVALANINPTHYEAAIIDGANRWQQTVYITLPGITSTIILTATLSLGNVLNAGFDQIFNMLRPVVHSTGDIIDTMIFRVGLEQGLFSISAAMGLFRSVVSFALIFISYRLAYQYAGYRIF